MSIAHPFLFLVAFCTICCSSFTQPKRSTSSISLDRWPSFSLSARVNSDNDLSNILNEYKSLVSPTDSAATSAPKMIESIADNTAEAVLSSLTTTAPLAEADFVDSSTNALTDAVSTAINAADQAAEAAAAVMAVASKTTAATKVAVAAIGTMQTEAVLEGVKILPGGFQFRPPEQAIVVSEKVREYFSIGKTNILSAIQYLEKKSENALPTVDLDFRTLSESSIIPSLVDTLHLKEYGGWYFATVMAITASQQRSVGRKEATLEFESELERAREKAVEAASAASLAAEGARMAKQVAMKMEKRTVQDGGNAILESSRLQQLLIENDLMEKQVRSLKTDLAGLQMQLDNLTSNNHVAENIPFLTEIEEDFPSRVVMERDPDEDSRIVEILKEMDEGNRLKKTLLQEQLEMKREQAAELLAKQKVEKEEARIAAVKEQLAKDEAAKLIAEAAAIAEQLAKDEAAKLIAEDAAIAEQLAKDEAQKRIAQAEQLNKVEEAKPKARSVKKAKNLAALEQLADDESTTVAEQLVKDEAQESITQVIAAAKEQLKEEKEINSKSRDEFVVGQVKKEKAAKLKNDIEELDLVTKEIDGDQLSFDNAREVITTSISKGSEVKKSSAPSLRSLNTKTSSTIKRKSVTKQSFDIPSAVNALDNKWSLLSDSTLKKKTVAEIADYLTERGVTVVDNSGKMLKKTELLEAVKSLQGR